MTQKLFPTSKEDFFEMMNKIVPGMKQLQIPLAKTIENIWPILKKDPDIIQNMMPTLHDIFNSAANEKTISKKDFASWGKRLLKSGGPHLKKWGISTKESLIQDLIKKNHNLNLYVLEYYQLKIFNDIVNWSQMMIGLMKDLVANEKPKSARGWFSRILKIFSSDDDNE